MKKVLTLEERYQIYIDMYVGDDEPKNDGSGTTVSGKRTIKSFLCRKRANNFIMEDGICYASKWLDEHNIPIETFTDLKVKCSNTEKSKLK